MTVGRPISLMIRFSLPLILANALQLIYTMVDGAVVGNMVGVKAYAAVGATASFYWMIFGAVISITQGFGTLFAQRFGAKDMDGLCRLFTTAAILSIILSVIMGCASAIKSISALKLLNTPSELMDGAALYLHYLLFGLSITFAYNLLGAMLRALGDSKTPFRSMIVATALNIILDLALVIPLGIAGVAIATLMAQITASIYCFVALQKTGIIRGNFQWDFASAKKLLYLGLPLGFRNAVIEVGALVVQRYVNNYGTEFVAGIAAAKQMYSLLLIACGAFEASCATFVAQNFGAKDYFRVKRGVASCLFLMLISSVVTMAFTLLFGRWVLSLLIKGDTIQITAVLNIGTRQLNVMAFGLPILCLLFLYRSALQGIGNAFIPMLSGFFELAMRIMSVIFLTPFLGEWGVFLSDFSGWVAATLLLIISYMIIAKRLFSIKKRENVDNLAE